MVEFDDTALEWRGHRSLAARGAASSMWRDVTHIPALHQPEATEGGKQLDPESINELASKQCWRTKLQQRLHDTMKPGLRRAIACGRLCGERSRGNGLRLCQLFPPFVLILAGCLGAQDGRDGIVMI